MEDVALVEASGWRWNGWDEHQLCVLSYSLLLSLQPFVTQV